MIISLNSAKKHTRVSWIGYLSQNNNHTASAFFPFRTICSSKKENLAPRTFETRLKAVSTQNSANSSTKRRGEQPLDAPMSHAMFFCSFLSSFLLLRFAEATTGFNPPAEVVPAAGSLFSTHLGTRPIASCPNRCRCSLTTIDCSKSDLTNSQLASMTFPSGLMSLNLYGNPRLTEVCFSFSFSFSFCLSQLLLSF